MALVVTAKVKFPGEQDRLLIVGRTGGGKTTAGMWHLSGRDFNKQPAVILNTKGDPFIDQLAELDGVQTITLDDTPGDTGLYIVSPTPGEMDKLDTFLARIWNKKNCLVYVDEGYMIKPADQLNALLTQGRTRNIPVIILTQRPSWITKFVFTECDFVQLFNLQTLNDRKNIGGLVPVDKNYRLPEHYSYWYNVRANTMVKFGPVPPPEQILETFRAKFPPKQAPEQRVNQDVGATDQAPKPLLKLVV